MAAITRLSVIGVPGKNYNFPAGGPTVGVVSESLVLADTADAIGTFSVATADSLTLNDSVTATIQTAASVDDAFSLADASAGFVITTATAEDSLNFTDSADPSRTTTASVGESLVFATEATVLATFPVAISETLDLADAADAIGTFPVDVDESLTLTDAADTLATFVGVADDSLLFEDSADVLGTFVATVDESLLLVDDIAVTQQGIVQAAAADSLVLADATDALAELFDSFSDSLLLEDSAEGFTITAGVIDDSLAFSTEVTVSATFVGASEDTLELSDETLALGTFLKASAESLVLDDDVEAFLTTAVSEDDSLSLTDSVEALNTIQVTSSESLVLDDAAAAIITTASAASDSLAFSETVDAFNTTQSESSDGLQLSDTASAVKTTAAAIAEDLLFTDLTESFFRVFGIVDENLDFSDSSTSAFAQVIPRGLSLLRSGEMVENVDGIGRAFRLSITAVNESLIPAAVFVHQRTLLDPWTGTRSDEFRYVASPMDLVLFPVDDPAPKQMPAFFRKSTVELLVPSRKEALELWNEIEKQVCYLVNWLNDKDDLVEAEDVRIGVPATAPSSSLSVSTSVGEEFSAQAVWTPQHIETESYGLLLPNSARELTIRRLSEEIVELPGKGRVFKVVLQAALNNLVPAEVFVHQKTLLDPWTGTRSEEFCYVASPVDLVYLPVDQPRETQMPAFYRKDTVTLYMPSREEVVDLWEHIILAVCKLVTALGEKDELVVKDDERIGDEPSAPVSSISLSEVSVSISPPTSAGGTDTLLFSDMAQAGVNNLRASDDTLLFADAAVVVGTVSAAAEDTVTFSDEVAAARTVGAESAESLLFSDVASDGSIVWQGVPVCTDNVNSVINLTTDFDGQTLDFSFNEQGLWAYVYFTIRHYDVNDTLINPAVGIVAVTEPLPVDASPSTDNGFTNLVRWFASDTPDFYAGSVDLSGVNFAIGDYIIVRALGNNSGGDYTPGGDANADECRWDQVEVDTGNPV